MGHPDACVGIPGLMGPRCVPASCLRPHALAGVGTQKRRAWRLPSPKGTCAQDIPCQGRQCMACPFPGMPRQCRRVDTACLLFGCHLILTDGQIQGGGRAGLRRPGLCGSFTGSFFRLPGPAWGGAVSVCPGRGWGFRPFPFFRIRRRKNRFLRINPSIFRIRPHNKGRRMRPPKTGRESRRGG